MTDATAETHVANTAGHAVDTPASSGWQRGNDASEGRHSRRIAEGFLNQRPAARRFLTDSSPPSTPSPPALPYLSHLVGLRVDNHTAASPLKAADRCLRAVHRNSGDNQSSTRNLGCDMRWVVCGDTVQIASLSGIFSAWYSGQKPDVEYGPGGRVRRARGGQHAWYYSLLHEARRDGWSSPKKNSTLDRRRGTPQGLIADVALRSQSKRLRQGFAGFSGAPLGEYSRSLPRQLECATTRTAGHDTPTAWPFSHV